jgi:hypothetical protein
MDEKLYANGINAVTGNYLLEPMEISEAACLVRGEKRDRATASWLKRAWQSLNLQHLALPMDVEPADLRQAGWGIVFHSAEDDAVKKSLAPLIEHRRAQVGDETKIKILEYKSGEKRETWLARHSIGIGSVRPEKVPYYLLLIGSPESIPFLFRHQLGVEYGVGSLHFDTADEYSRYAAGVIDYETREAIPTSKEAIFFGVRHPFDAATQMSADRLIKPLTEPSADGEKIGLAEKYGFRSRKILAADATKKALAATLSPPPDEKPASLLFTASHGMGFPAGHPQQKTGQGALLCQDWPGFGAVRPDHYFSAADLPATARVHGMITFHFACYGMGTPSHDRFIHEPGAPPPAIAPQSFIAALPKALLAHPAGGALACIGHVERAWGCSIVTAKAGSQLLPFENAIGRILKGEPVGLAMKDFYERYASLSVSLSSMLEEISFGATVADTELAAAWIARNDAEGYLILGDPAVRLRGA